MPKGAKGYNAVTEGFGVRFLGSVLLESVVGRWWGIPAPSLLLPIEREALVCAALCEGSGLQGWQGKGKSMTLVLQCLDSRCWEPQPCDTGRSHPSLRCSVVLSQMRGLVR